MTANAVTHQTLACVCAPRCVHVCVCVCGGGADREQDGDLNNK